MLGCRPSLLVEQNEKNYSYTNTGAGLYWGTIGPSWLDASNHRMSNGSCRLKTAM